MVQVTRDSLSYMFTATDALELCTICPDGNEAASKWADAWGWRQQFRRENCFDLIDERVGASFRALDYATWVTSDPANIALGDVFHTAAREVGLADHPHDPAHEAWVGATLAGCRAGNIGKAISMYNRWARFAGYAEATILSLTPPLVDVGDALVELIDGHIEVLRSKA